MCKKYTILYCTSVKYSWRQSNFWTAEIACCQKSIEFHLIWHTMRFHNYQNTKGGTSYRDFYIYVPIMSGRCFEFSAKNYHIGLSFVQKIYHFVLHISQIFLWTKCNNHSLLWNYTSISALTECVLSLFMVSKWFLVQLWSFNKFPY